MKRFLITQFLLLTTSGFLIAQTVYTDKRAKVDVGPAYPHFELTPAGFITDGNNIVIIRAEKKLLTLQHFSRNDMKLTSSKEYEDMPDDYIYEGFIQLKNKIFCAYSTYPSRTLIPHFFVREIDLDKGTFKGAGIELFAADKKVESLNVYFKNHKKFKIFLNTDSTSFLVQYIRPSSVGMLSIGPETHGLYIFDSELKKIRGSEVRLPYHEKQMRTMDFTFDAAGNIYMSLFRFNKANNSNFIESADKDYKGEIFKLFKDDTEFKRFDFNLGGKVANFIKMIYHPEGYIICAGVYSSAATLKKSEGIFTCRLNENNSITEYKKNDFKPELFKSSKKKPKVEPDEYFKVKDIKIEPDNGILVFTQQIFHFDELGYINRHYDLILTKFDPTYNVSWMTLLPMKLWGLSGVDAPNFRYLKSGNSMYLVFVDDYDNVGSYNASKEIVEHEEGIHGFINCYKVDATNGDIINFPILDMKNVNGKEYHNYSSREVINFKTNELWYEVYKKGKENCMIRIILED